MNSIETRDSPPVRFRVAKEKPRDRYIYVVVIIVISTRYTMCDGYTRVFSVNFYLIVVFFFARFLQTVKTLRCGFVKKKNSTFFSVFSLSISLCFVRVLKSLIRYKTTGTRLSVSYSQTFRYFSGKLQCNKRQSSIQTRHTLHGKRDTYDFGSHAYMINIIFVRFVQRTRCINTNYFHSSLHTEMQHTKREKGTTKNYPVYKTISRENG